MKSVYDLVSENRQECIDFLQKNNNKYEFVHFDKEEDDWCDDEGPVDLQEGCPFVTYADDDGNIINYAVIAIYLINGRFVADLVDPCDYKNKFEKIPVSWLYGVSECYIYEHLSDKI